MKKIKHWGVMATILLLSTVCLTGCTSGMNFFSDDTPNTTVAESKEINSDFVLQDTEGKIHKLSDYKGKKVYLKFWASWCSVCMKTIGETNALAGENHEDFVVLSVVAPGVAGEMPNDQFISWFHGLGYKNLTVLLDEGGKVTRNYGIRFYPTSAIIDSNGKVRDIRPGHMPTDRIREIMKEIP